MSKITDVKKVLLQLLLKDLCKEETVDTILPLLDTVYLEQIRDVIDANNIAVLQDLSEFRKKQDKFESKHKDFDKNYVDKKILEFVEEKYANQMEVHVESYLDKRLNDEIERINKRTQECLDELKDKVDSAVHYASDLTNILLRIEKEGISGFGLQSQDATVHDYYQSYIKNLVEQTVNNTKENKND